MRSASKSISQKVSNLIDRLIKLVSNSNGDIVEICKINKNINMPLAHNCFCCMKMYQVLIMNNDDYFIYRITSS